MATTADFRNGLCFNHNGDHWRIESFLHVKPGKGGAFVRTKLKNIKTGQVIDETFRGGANVTSVRVEARNYNFLYSENENYIFMDNETYEQIELPLSLLKDIKPYLIEILKLL